MYQMKPRDDIGRRRVKEREPNDVGCCSTVLWTTHAFDGLTSVWTVHTVLCVAFFFLSNGQTKCAHFVEYSLREKGNERTNHKCGIGSRNRATLSSP